MLPKLKPLTPVVTRHVTSSSWPEYSISNTQSPLSSKCFHCSCYVTHCACFYVMRAVKMFYFIELLQLAVVQQVFGTCDWLLFLFTIITLRSLVTILWRIYDEVMTILWSTYDFSIIGPLSTNCIRGRTSHGERSRGIKVRNLVS